MPSQVEIMNLALLRLGTRAQVQSPTENSREAAVCSLLYDSCVSSTLAAFPWGFATKREALADLGSPPADWTYRYRYPIDCLRARNIVRPDGEDRPPIPFEIAYDGVSGRVILTDQAEAVLRYTVELTNPSAFDPEFVYALSWHLASEAALPLTDSPAVKEQTFAIYQSALRQAWAATGNEGEPKEPVYLSEFERARA